MSEIMAGMVLQLRLFRRNSNQIQVFAFVPFYTAIFLSVVELADQPGLDSYAVVAPTIMTVWSVSLNMAASIVNEERRGGTLELFLASPGNFTRALTGRVATISFWLVFIFAESCFVARVVFRAQIRLSHPWLLILTLIATSLATLGVATVLAAVFVAARSPMHYANALGYPIFLLGGVMVPISFLPDWLRPLSSVIYLTWVAELLRSVLAPGSIPGFLSHVTFLLILGSSTYLSGSLIVARMLLHMKKEGSVTNS